MTPRLGDYLLLAPPVLLLSGAALYWAEAPFGWVHVLVVYLLATFPLCVVLADFLAVRADRRVLAAAGAVFGLALIMATVFAGSAVRGWLVQRDADLFVRQGTLGLWCVLLQLPLCLFGRWVIARYTWKKPAPEPSWAAVGLALFIAAALPAVYVARVIETESRKAEELLAAGRRWKASALAGKLCEVGSGRLLAGESPVALWLLPFGTHFSSGPARVRPMTDAERMEEAKSYASFDEFDKAARLLLPLTGRDPAAALLLASVYKEQEKWKECGQYCQLARALLERLPRNAETLPLWVTTYDNLAAVAQHEQRYDEARGIYEEALRRVEPARAHFHIQLGRLHHTAGRPGKALHHLQEALALDPEMAGRVRPVLDDIRQHTPGCLLRWWGP